MKPNLTSLTSLLFIVALFAPSNLNIYPDSDYVTYNLVGMSYEIIGLSLGDFALSFAYFLIGFPFMFLRVVFVYQIYKYYLGLSSRKRVIITGILAELQFFLIGLAVIPIGISNPYIAVIISVPIPILFLSGLAVLHFIQRPQEITEYSESDKERDWLENQEEKPN